MYDYFVFYVGLLWFGLICLTWTSIAVILHPLMPKASGMRVGRIAIMRGFHLFLATLQLSGRMKFDLHELDALRDEKSLIIAPNHPSLWDVVLINSRLPDVASVMKAEIIGNLFLGAGARLARYIHNQSTRQMIMLAMDDLQRGGNVLLFPEGTRTIAHPIGPLKGSIGVIACRAKASVQTVFIETDSPFLTKGWPVYKKPPMPMTYRIRLGRRFEAPANSAAFMIELEQYFTKELAGAEPVQLMPKPLAVPDSAVVLAE